MKEYYRNCDPDEKDQIEDDKPLCERRILHVVSTALSYGTLKNAILFTFDDHPIIPELVMNSDKTLDQIIEEKKMKLEDKQSKKLRELKILLEDEDDEDIVKVLKKIKSLEDFIEIKR